MEHHSLLSSIESRLAEIADIAFVSVAETFFHGKIHGGSMPLGPIGVVAVRAARAPQWLRAKFDQGEIVAESSDDDEVKELLKLIDDGDAAIVPPSQTYFMHIDSKVSNALRFGEESESSKSDVNAWKYNTSSPCKKARVE